MFEPSVGCFGEAIENESRRIMFGAAFGPEYHNGTVLKKAKVRLVPVYSVKHWRFEPLLLDFVIPDDDDNVAVRLRMSLPDLASIGEVSFAIAQ
jgi:hypothetical protein